MEQIFDQYRSHLEELGRTSTTIKGYLADLKRFVRWLEGKIGQPFSPANVVPLDVQQYKLYMQEKKKLAASTVNRRLQALRSFFGWAHNRGLAQRDPTDTIELVSTTRRQFAPKSLNEEQAYRLVRAAQRQRYPERDYAILRIMLEAGLRASEVASLHRDDVVLKRGSGQVTVRRGKGGKERRVPLNRAARSALRKYLAVRPDLGDPHLFISQRGGKLSPRSIGFIVDRCQRVAGLDEEDISPHNLRHTFATRYLEKNPGRIGDLATLLGHSSLEMVTRYTQSSFDEVADSVERLYD